jgi:hypothetical protein
MAKPEGSNKAFEDMSPGAESSPLAPIEELDRQAKQKKRRR